MKRLRMWPAVGLLVLAGCTSGSDSGAGESGSIAVVDADAGSPMEESGDIPASREIITTGSLTMVVEEVTEGVDDVIAVVEGAGGRVDSRSETAATDDYDASAWLTVRVPAGELDGVIDRLGDLGQVRDLTVNSQDVTRYGQDLDARIRALEASTERLLELMAEADSSEALIAAESALAERQAELEAKRSEREFLSAQVAMSTLEISLVTERAPQFEAGGFLGGLKSGWAALVGFVSGALVALGAAVPWVIALGIPLGVLVWFVRRRRRSRRAKSGAPGSAQPVDAAE